MLRVGSLAELTGLTVRTLHHYDELGLVRPSRRTAAGYRLYDDATLHTLQFIRRARDLGFSMAEITELLGLWRDRERSSAAVKRLAQGHVDALQRRIDELEAMKRTLSSLTVACQGNDRPDCPILDDLARPHHGCAG